MDKKQRNDIASYLIGISDMPQGIPGCAQQAAMATKNLKRALDRVDVRGLPDAINKRNTAAAAYSIQTKKPWPF